LDLFGENSDQIDNSPSSDTNGDPKLLRKRNLREIITNDPPKDETLDLAAIENRSSEVSPNTLANNIL